jgi:hypothetical protein
MKRHYAPRVAWYTPEVLPTHPAEAPSSVPQVALL